MAKAAPPVGKNVKFQAALEDWAEGMDYCAIPVPEDVTEAMGTKGPVLVEAQVNGSKPFQVSLFPVGGGRHYIRIKAKVRKETKTKSGDEVTVRFTVLDRAKVVLPDDLREALEAEGALEAFQAFPPGKQNFTIRQIDQAAKADTRARRIEKAVETAHKKREEMRDKGR